MSKTRTMAALALSAIAFAQPRATEARIEIDVFRRDRPLTGLHAEDFSVSRDGAPMVVRAVSERQVPLDIILIADRGWFPGQGLLFMNAASGILKRTGLEDRVAVIELHSEPTIELPFTNDRTAIAGTLRRLGATEGNDWGSVSERLSFEYAVRMFRDAGGGAIRRRLILRIGINQSGYADEPVIRELRQAGVVYSVVYLVNTDLTMSKPLLGGRRLEPDHAFYRNGNPSHIAYATGGDVVLFEPGKAEDILTPHRLHYVLTVDGLTNWEQVTVDLSPEARSRFPDAIVTRTNAAPRSQ